MIKSTISFPQLDLQSLFTTGISQAALLLDPQGLIKGFNNSVVELYLPPTTGFALDSNILEYLHPTDRDNCITCIHQALSTDTSVNPIQSTCRFRDLPQEFECVYSPIYDLNQKVCGVCLSLHTPLKNASTSEARFRSLVQNSTDIITILDSQANIIFQSPSAAGILGYANGLVGENVFDYVHPEDISLVKAGLIRKIRQPHISRKIEYRFKHADGRWIHLETIGNNLLDDPQIRGIVTNTRDVSERKKMQQDLSYEATHDSLTNLPNRTLFLEKLSQALKVWQQDSAAGFGVFFMDLDRFKIINDSLGHTIGDKLLIAVVERLERFLDSRAILSRLGGDEFTILATHIKDIPQAVELAKGLCKVVEEPFQLESHEVFVTLSVGVVLAGPGHRTPEDLLRDADTAMYRAKWLGRNRYEVYDAQMRRQVTERLRGETELRRALPKNQFCLFYQPIACLSSRRWVGCEALIRWLHPERGLLGPADFLGLAEETGILADIDLWVFEEVCRQVSLWKDYLPPDFRICLNLSAARLKHPSLLVQIKSVLDTYELTPEYFQLELTEGVVMKDTPKFVDLLHELKQEGYRLALDDFGTGYSSLAYLKLLPIDVVKIDRSFISDIDTSKESIQIVQAIVSLSHTLGLKVVVEGVETKQQVDLLSQSGCDFGQGYYFSHPLASQEFIVHMQSDPGNVLD